MTVNMPVEAISEKCINCPELEIDINTLEINGITLNDEGVPEEVNRVQNTLKCTHYNRCKWTVDNVLKEPDKKEEKKEPVKKRTTTKTSTKVTKSAKTSKK